MVIISTQQRFPKNALTLYRNITWIFTAFNENHHVKEKDIIMYVRKIVMNENIIELSWIFLLLFSANHLN